MRAFVVGILLLLLVPLSRPAFAQDPPPPIPWVVVDLHGSIPRFPSDNPDLAESRNMSIAELPGTGLGAQIGLHLYPLHTRFVTFGLAASSRSVVRGRRRWPEPSAPMAMRFARPKSGSRRCRRSCRSTSATASGWSYLSGGTRTVHLVARHRRPG